MGLGRARDPVSSRVRSGFCSVTKTAGLGAPGPLQVSRSRLHCRASGGVLWKQTRRLESGNYAHFQLCLAHFQNPLQEGVKTKFI